MPIDPKIFFESAPRRSQLLLTAFDRDWEPIERFEFEANELDNLLKTIVSWHHAWLGIVDPALVDVAAMREVHAWFVEVEYVPF